MLVWTYEELLPMRNKLYKHGLRSNYVYTHMTRQFSVLASISHIPVIGSRVVKCYAYTPLIHCSVVALHSRVHSHEHLVGMRPSYSRRRLNDRSCEQKYVEIVVINGPCLLGRFGYEGHVLPCRRNNSHMHTSHPPIHKHSTPTDLKQYENRGETVEHITALVRARLRMVV